MDWNRLKNFKKKFHLVRKAAEAMSQTNINFNIKYEKDKGLNYTLKLPQENEIARFASVLIPLADPSSQLYFKDIASIFLQNNILTIASSEKDNLIKEIQKAELGLIRLNINNESLSALDLYLI